MAENKTSIVITATDLASAVIGKVSGAIGGLAAPAAAANAALASLSGGAALLGLGAIAKNAIDAADGLNDLSQKTGIAVKDLAAYKLAAEQSGTSLDGVAGGMKKLASALVDNREALKSAGITATDTSGAMRQLAELFAALPDGAEKSALATKLFGKAGQELIPLLNLGAEGLDKSAKASERYGEAMKLLAPEADKFNDSMSEISLNLQAAGAELANSFLPQINKAIESFNLAREAGLGFFQAITGIGVRDLSETLEQATTNAGPKIQAISKEIEKLRAQPPIELWDGSIDQGAAERIKQLEKLLEYYKKLQLASVNSGPQFFDARDLKLASAATLEAALRAKTLNDALKDSSKSAKALKDEFADLLTKINAKEAGLDPQFVKDVDMLAKGLAAGRIGAERYAEELDRLVRQTSLYKDQAKDAAKAADEILDAEEKARLAIEKSIGGLREKIEAMQLETQLMGLSADERERTILLLALEAEKANLSADAYDQLRAKMEAALDASKTKRAAVEAVEASKKAWEDMARDADKFFDELGQSLTNELMRGTLDAGELMKNYFRTLVLRPTIEAVLSPVKGAVMSALGAPTSTASSASSLLNTGSNLYSIGGAIGSAAATSSYATFGGMGLEQAAMLAAQESGLGIAATASTLEAAGASSALASVGTAVPYVAAAIAAAQLLGLFDDEAEPEFGLRQKKRGADPKFDAYTSLGKQNVVESPFGILRATAKHVDDNDKVAKGLADKFLKPIAQLDSLLAAQLDKSELKEVQDVLNNWTTGESKNGENFKKKLQERLGTISDTIGGTVDQIFDTFQASMQDGYALLVTALAVEGDQAFEALLTDLASNTSLAKEGETAAAGAVRLVEGLRAVNAVLEDIGQPLLDVSIAGSAAAAGLLDAFGGLEQLQAGVANYFGAFYTEQEKLDLATNSLAEQFAKLNVEMPDSKEAFRDLVESLDLTSTSGQDTYAALIKIAPAFAEITSATEAMAEAAINSAAKIAAQTVSLNNQARSLIEKYQNTDAVTAARSTLSGAGINTAGLSADQLRALAISTVQGRSVDKAFATADIVGIAKAALTAYQATGAGFSGNQFDAVKIDAAINSAGTELAAILGDEWGSVADTIESALSAALKAGTDRTGSKLDEATLTSGLNDVPSLLNTLSKGLLGDFTGNLQGAFDTLIADAEKVAESVGSASESAAKVIDTTSSYDAEAARQAQIKLSLERQILEITGDTAAIRALELAGLDAANQALQQRIWNLQDEAEATRAANQAIDSALAGVRRAVDAEISAVQTASDNLIKGWNDQITALNETRSTAQDAATAMATLFNTIEGGVKQLRGSIDPQMDRAQARGFIDMALALAQSGAIPDQQKLADAISKVTQDSTDAYATRLEFIRAQAVQAGKLEQLGLIVGKQKTIAEQQLEAIESQERALRDQISAQQTSASQQVAALNAQYTKAQEQVDVLRGIDTSIKSVGDAIMALGAALQVQTAANAAAASAARASADAAASAQAQAEFAQTKTSGYGSVTIQLPDGTFYGSGGGISAGQGVGGGKGTIINGVRSYDVGTAYVPGDMTANIHKGEIIIDPTSANILRKYGIGMNVGGDPAMAAELAALRAELKAALGAVASNTRQTKDLLDSTINGGNTIRTEVIV